ncbi:hypothetical protein BDR06DRAFT_199240 [Suillus hirtellus]|nr:hypothetical protein BDR06DRAFT_199240 [Suillus hirtellus]
MLQDTSVRVTTLRGRCLASTNVTQDIAGCFVEIDRYLAEYLWSSQMQSRREVHEMFVILQREQEDRQKFLMTIESLVARAQSSVGPTATRGCVTLIDATGHQYPIPVDFCTSFEQFNDMLKVLFKRNSIEAQIQRQYMESGQYDLCIDEGMQVIRLTNDEWSRLEVGTKVVMRVIIQQWTTSSSGVSYRCSCGTVNPLGVGSIVYSLEQHAGSSIDCRNCGRRFQISRVSSREKRCTSARSSNIDFDCTSDAGTDLIRNFHVQQTEFSSVDEAFQCLWGDCNHIIFGHQISRHLLEFHGLWAAGITRVICLWNHCNKELMKTYLVRHVQTHLMIKFYCDTCPKAFSRRDVFNHHKITCTGLQQ